MNLMNKRGASPLLMLFEVVAILIVVFTLIMAAQRAGSADTVRKSLIAEDIQLMVNLLVATPGEVLIRYPQDVSDFNIILESGGVIESSDGVIESGSVAVYIPGEAEQLWEIRRFYLPDGYTTSGPVQQRAEICLHKTGKQITLQEECPA